MTLPINSNLPPYTIRVEEDKESLSKYLGDLSDGLERMYDDIVNVVNGTFRQNGQVGNLNWSPVLKGTTIPGTFTYTHQIGKVLRQGLITDCWFDVEWPSAGAATGNLALTLPYKVALVDEMPFVGILQISNVTLTAGTNLVINGISNSFNGEFWCVGDGVATANQTIADSGSGRIIGHIRYIGQNDEPA